MTKINKLVLLSLCCTMIHFFNVSNILGQEEGNTLRGKVLESGSAKPIPSAIISIASTGEFTNSGEEGNFSIELSKINEKISVSLPGYHPTSLRVNNASENIIVYLTPLIFESNDAAYVAPLEEGVLRNSTRSISVLNTGQFDKSAGNTFDAAINSKVAGLRVIEHSGMPGHISWMNIRGISSIYGQNQPLVYIDGMIHETRYPLNYLISGHMLNPAEIVDLDDIVDISVHKSNPAYLGAAGSNGVIYVNTEKSKETSSEINFKLSGGFSLAPATLDVMDAGQYKTYLNQVLAENGYSSDQIDAQFPWLNGGSDVPEYYRYSNNTNWQDLNFRNAPYQKYHFFLKGGDDIATYNISTGYLVQGGPFEDWRYSRYNLRLNGRINISNKFSIIPNSKLSLSDSHLSNMGPEQNYSPVLANLLNPPVLGPFERTETGSELTNYDDVSSLNTSNPSALIKNSLGSGRNVQLASSVKAVYNLNSKLTVSTLVGLTVNNDRENLFIPDVGVVDVGAIRNVAEDMVTEYRSLQLFPTISYKNNLAGDHDINAHAGIRYMKNSYKNNLALDFNTPTDDFRSLGRGSGFEYLRVSSGDITGLKWLSYFGTADYIYLDNYYLSASVSVDALSRLNSENRWNFYPSLAAAWRVTDNLSDQSNWLNDLKLRASWDISGNMFSDIYYFSQLFYTGRRYTNRSAVVRDYNPNFDMQLEKKTTYDIGLELLSLKKSLMLQFDVYYANVGNLIINQLLPYNFGFTNYFDNGGKLVNYGAELSANYRKHSNNFLLILDGSVTTQFNRVSKLDFIDPNTDFLVTSFAGAEYITSEENAVNAFYGYKTNGIYNTNSEANGIIGPNGREMGAGDVIFEDVNGDNAIDDNDKQIIGDPNPLLFGALSSTFQFKNFEFMVLFNYCYGNDIYNYVRYQITAMDDFSNQSPDVLDRWRTDNTGATLPRAALGDPAGNNVFSDRFIEDGSYLKIKEVRLSYNIGRFSEALKDMDVFLTASNLFTFTKYTGYDPETMYLSNPFMHGLDLGKIPHTRTFIIGVKLAL